MTAPVRPAQSTLEIPAYTRPASARPAFAAGPRIATRFADRAERDRVVAWLEAGLRPGRPGRLEREYPLLFEAHSAAVPITVWTDGRPASFCFLWPVAFELVRGRLRTGLVSLVYTDPRDRGRGLARTAIARALREARAMELGLCLLWSDLADFYANQGFSPAGHETLLVVDSEVLARARARQVPRDMEGLQVERARADDWPAIAAIRARRSCHAPLPADPGALAAIPGLDVRVARGRDGVAAFAMCGRGDDFGGVIHEWAGEAVAVLRCCEALIAETASEGGLLLLAPDEPSELTHALRAAGAHRVRNPLAWFTIASPSALAADLAALVPDVSAALRIEPSPPSAGAQPGFTLTERASGRACRLASAELLALLFSTATESASAAARARLESIVPAGVLASLPLPFFVWGLESI